jgi:putative glycosyltransferase (TIGR04348 family)
VRIRIVIPPRAAPRSGNRVSADRWARLLRGLGHRVAVSGAYGGEPCDLLIGLHARKSFLAIRAYRRLRPSGPLVVALGGTDLYHDLPRSRRARASLEWADRIVVLQPLARCAVPPRLRAKTRAILQSAPRPRGRIEPPEGEFRVLVLAHLRPVKDPFRAALAASLLPPSSRVRILHFGRAPDRKAASRARERMRRNPRYIWRGEVSRAVALRHLAGSRLLVLTSRLEGGANVVSEALAAGVPIVSSRIPGSVGILGPSYPGYFRAGDTRGLARLLARCESDSGYYEGLQRRCRRLAPLVRPSRERAAWKRLLSEIGVPERSAISAATPGRPVMRR